jgi:hypothetical protein
MLALGKDAALVKVHLDGFLRTATATHARAMRLTQQSRLMAETASSRGLGAATAASASKKSW